MSSAITPVDDFSATIYAPDPGDSRADAAEVVTAIAQIMADRTLHLKNLDDLKAILAAANVFTAAPQTIDATDNQVPLIKTTKGAHDDPAVPTNGWKTIAEFDCDGTRKFRIFSGANDSSGLMAITVNAFWHKSDSKWRPDTTSKDSFGMFAFTEALTVSRQTAGPGSWSLWPAGGGDIIAGNSVTATVLSASGNVNAFADCNVAGNVVVAGEVQYPLGGLTPGFKPRTKLIPLVPALTQDGTGLKVNSNGNIECNSSGPFVWWPIVLPRGSQLLKVEWIHSQSTSTPSSVDVHRRTAADYGAPSTTAFASIAGGVSGPASSGVKLSTNDFTGSPVAISEAEEYRAVWLAGAPGTGADNVQQIRVTFNDPGARSN